MHLHTSGCPEYKLTFLDYNCLSAFQYACDTNFVTALLQGLTQGMSPTNLQYEDIL